MNPVRIRCLIIASVLLALFSLPPIASADGITWDLVGVTFSDGGTASGSFVYDATTNTYSDIDITTTAGSAFGGATYTFIGTEYVSSAGEMILVTTLGDLANTPTLVLYFDGGELTNLGGTLSVSGIGEGICNNTSDCSVATELREITGGEVVASTPEPPALSLLSIGLVLLLAAASFMQKTRLPSRT